MSDGDGAAKMKRTGDASDASVREDAYVPPTQAAVARVPRQERGRRRVDDLLDAADALISEVGIADASVQEIARRAGASVGSLYHFFPTKDAVVEALRQRYHAQLDEMTGRVRDSADEWARLPLPEFVDALLAPLAAFLDANPGFLSVEAGPSGGDVTAHTRHAGHAALRIALIRRNPALPETAHDLRATVFSAIVESVMGLMLNAPEPRRADLLRELRQATLGYLRAGESDTAPEARAR
jgi:AcrR family transcriptional regulator